MLVVVGSGAGIVARESRVVVVVADLRLRCRALAGWNRLEQSVDGRGVRLPLIELRLQLSHLPLIELLQFAEALSVLFRFVLEVNDGLTKLPHLQLFVLNLHYAACTNSVSSCLSFSSNSLTLLNRWFSFCRREMSSRSVLT